ncbi:MAG: hypothetical protein AAB066_05090 [Candidatus Margulisiibacteriota bacterium]
MTSTGSLVTRNVSGTTSFLGMGTSSATNFKTAAEGNFILWAQNQGTQRIYFAEIDSDGQFSLDVQTDATVENGNTFFFGIIQKDPTLYSGPITMATSTASAVGGIVVSDNATNVAILFDGSIDRGVISNGGAAITGNATFKVRLVTNGGRPVGMGNFGKGTASMTTSLNTANMVDPDEDGLPDIFDAMNDGQRLDNTVANSWMSQHSTNMAKVVMFMEIDMNTASENSFSVTNDAVVAVELRPNDASAISSMTAIRVNASYQNSRIHSLPASYNALETYPSPNTLWSSTSFRLYKAQNASGEVVWTVRLDPENNTFDTGDVILVEVTYTNGSKEYFWLQLNFKFSTMLNDTSLWLLGSGSVEAPYRINIAGGIDFTYQAPRDENNNLLVDMDYAMRTRFYGTSNVQIGNQNMISIGEDILVSTLTQAQVDAATASPSYLEVDLMATYPYGDHAMTRIYVKRSNW